MILSPKLKGSFRGDKLKPLYSPLARRCLDGAVLPDSDPTALLLLRGALVVGEGAGLQHAPVLAHGRQEVAALEQISLKDGKSIEVWPKILLEGSCSGNDGSFFTTDIRQLRRHSAPMFRAFMHVKRSWIWLWILVMSEKRSDTAVCKCKV